MSRQATSTQIATLLDFLTAHKDLARGALRGPDARLRAKKLWAEVTEILNSLGGAQKTAVQWQKVWADRKHLVKKQDAARNRDYHGTGGGPASGSQVSQLEEKILSIMGQNFGGPQSGARTPAFLGDENQSPNLPMVVEEEQVEEEDVVYIDHDHQYSMGLPLSPCLQPQPLARTPLAPIAFTSSQQPQPMARAPLASIATSSSQQPQPSTGRSSLSPIPSTSSQQPQPLARTPLAPIASTSRRRQRNRAQNMRSQPNVAGRLLDGEGAKVAVLTDIKNALTRLVDRMDTMIDTMVNLVAAVKELKK